MADGPEGMSSTFFSWQFLRFGIAGVATNLLLYLTYLALVGLGLQYPLAMTVSYVAGVVLGFRIQRQWTFRHRGPRAAPAVRFLFVYAAGYLLNLLGLYLLVEHARAGPASAQAMMVIVVAMCLYLAQKHWVFRTRDLGPGAPVPSGRREAVGSDPQ